MNKKYNKEREKTGDDYVIFSKFSFHINGQYKNSPKTSKSCYFFRFITSCWMDGCNDKHEKKDTNSYKSDLEFGTFRKLCIHDLMCG